MLRFQIIYITNYATRYTEGGSFSRARVGTQRLPNIIKKRDGALNTRVRFGKRKIRILNDCIITKMESHRDFVVITTATHRE